MSEAACDPLNCLYEMSFGEEILLERRYLSPGHRPAISVLSAIQSPGLALDARTSAQEAPGDH
jgi:hypothetical protein